MSESRLQKILAHAGFGSRRACEEFIVDGRVTVDGIVVRQLGSKADPETQTVALDGQKITGPGRVSKTVRESADLVYYMLNKPAGVLCTNEDPSGRPLAVQLIPESRRIYCVGRLDKDTEGLLLLTNDGELTNQLTHPSYGVHKTYLAKVNGRVGMAQVKKLEHGVHLSEGRTQGSRVRVRKSMERSSTLEMVIAEGMNRQVRRMLARVDLRCQKLKRTAIGPLRLGSLPVGGHRKLTADELEALRRAIAAAKAESEAHSEAKSEKSAFKKRSEEHFERKRGARKPETEPVADEFEEKPVEDLAANAEMNEEAPAPVVGEPDAEALSPEEAALAETASETPSQETAEVAADDGWDKLDETEDEDFEEVPSPVAARQTRDRGPGRDPQLAQFAREVEKPERREGAYQKREGGYQKREGGYQKREGGYQKRDGGGYQKREGGYQKRDGGGYQKREGGYQKRDGGGYQKREGGYQKREGSSYPKREGGYQKREGGYQKREGGYQKREGSSYPKREGGYQKREGGYQKREGTGYQKREGGYQKREGTGYQKREGGYQKREGTGYQKREGGYQKREGTGYQKREGGYQKREGTGYQKREGGYQKREGTGYQKREGGYQKREGTGYQKREGGYQKREGTGYQKREGGYQKREGGFQKRPGGSFQKREGGAYSDRPWENRSRAPRPFDGKREERGGSHAPSAPTTRPWERRQKPGEEKSE